METLGRIYNPSNNTIGQGGMGLCGQFKKREVPSWLCCMVAFFFEVIFHNETICLQTRAAHNVSHHDVTGGPLAAAFWRAAAFSLRIANTKGSSATPTTIHI